MVELTSGEPPLPVLIVNPNETPYDSHHTFYNNYYSHDSYYDHYDTTDTSSTTADNSYCSWTNITTHTDHNVPSEYHTFPPNRSEKNDGILTQTPTPGRHKQWK
jgi:hypothetical protein